MTINEYAKHRGVDPKAVREKIRLGKIPYTSHHGKHKVDPKLADEAWAKNVDSSKAYSGFKREIDSAIDAPPITRSEAYIKAYKAKLAELEYKERTCEVINKKKVYSDLITAHRIFRDALRNLPQRIAPEIASEVDPAKCEIIMLKEIDACLEELALLADKFK